MALVLHPEFQLYERKDMPFCSSLQVAEEFGKRHADVIRDIRNLDCSDDFNQRNFASVKYTDEKEEKRPMYLMTRDGFMFLVMGYSLPLRLIFPFSHERRQNHGQSFTRVKSGFPVYA